MDTVKNKKKGNRPMLNPVRNDYNESDVLDELIEELQTLQTLNHKGYDFEICTYYINAGDKEQLSGVLNHLSASRPALDRLKVIAVRTG
ncbi:hypothetical protein N9X59_02900 [Alphaproteobacteria bacterium]|nr:hypothetical protein [Alphaproteobacteria bacterium]